MDRARPAFESSRTALLLAAGLIAGGLALAGSVSRTAGGAIVTLGWVVAIASLHRLGRAGPEPPPPRSAGADKGAA